VAKPHLVRIRVRMYQVGFGDCFLVSFEYDGKLDDGRSERHVLIDFGSTRLLRGAKTLTPIAEQIRQHANEQIDVVVVTHRHKDHLSAFGEDGIAELLGDPNPPKLVVRSWTEHPDISAGARGPGVRGRGARPRGAVAAREAPPGIGPKSQAFLATLDRAQGFATKLHSAIALAPASEIGGELRQMAADQLKNEAAVDQLAAWAGTDKGTYLFYGQPSGIEEVVPGIRVTVLGPPTVDQHAAVTSQRESDADEFWMLYTELVDEAQPLQLLESLVASGHTALEDFGDGTDGDTEGDLGVGTAVEPDTAGEGADGSDTADAGLGDGGLSRSRKRHGPKPVGDIGPVRWLTDRMARQQVNSFLRIVRILDGVLNNTSVILLVEADGPKGTTRMLFPGDAQIENWEFALKVADEKDATLQALSQIDLYKVGHHGSRNATPHTLFDLWLAEANVAHPMTALMSTKTGVHGKHTETAVPRATLVAALKRRTALLSTTSLQKRVSWHEVVADLSTGTGFAPLPAGSG
jgi:beta-lactamase superfamily II metal-dependent hydrolase